MRDRSPDRGLRDRSHRFLEEIQRVGEALPRRGAQYGRARHLAAPLLERHQASGEVAAVHGGDVTRQERLKVRRLVPVEQVPLIVSEALDALERAPYAHRQLARTDVAEVVRRERREEHHADVGGRRAVGSLFAWFLLVVVDGQPLIVRAHEHVEEAPRQAGQEPKLAPVVGSQLLLARPGRLTHPPRKLGRDEPEHQERAGHQESRRPRQRDERCGRHREDRGRDHLAPEQSARRPPAEPERGIRSRRPLKEMLARERHPDGHPDHGVDHDDRFVGEERDRQCAACEVQRTPPAVVQERREARYENHGERPEHPVERRSR